MQKNVPPLGEVYNLLDQDYSERSINPVQNATGFQMTATQNIHPSINAAYNAPKQRPMCSHCGYTGNTVDKCYQIHGYPPGFKHKVKPFSADKQQIKPVVAQLALQDAATQELNVPEMINTLSKDQIQSVIAYFNTQLNTSPASNSTPSTSMGTITTLPVMAFSTSSLCFVGMLRATGNCLTSQ